MKQRYIQSLVLFAFVLALFASSCKSHPGQAGPPTKAAKAVKIGYLPITDHLTVIAKARSKHSWVDFQPTRFGSWPELSEALKAGKIDGAFVLSPIALGLRAKGLPLRAVLLGHRNGSVIMVGRDGPIRHPSDLVGKTVAIPNRFSTHNILLHKLLEAEKIDSASVKVIELAPPEMVSALATRRIDAFIVAEPFGAQAEVQGIGRVLTLSKDIWPDHVCCVLVVLEQTISQAPEAVQELVSSLVDTAQFIEEDPRAAAELSRNYLGQPTEIIVRALTSPTGRVSYRSLEPRVEDFAATEEALRKFGISDAKIDLGTYIDDRFGRLAYSQLEPRR